MSTSLFLTDYILIAGAFITLLNCIYLFYTAKKGEQYILLGTALFFLAGYIFSNFAIDYFRSESTSLFWVQMSAVCMILLVIHLFLFSKAFLSNNDRIDKFSLVFCYLLGAGSTFLAFSELTIEGVDIKTYPVQVIKGPLYYLIIGCILIFSVITLFYSLSRFKSISKFKKYQIRYIFLGLFASLLVTATTNVLLPWFGIGDYARIGPTFLIFFGILSTYATVTTSLIDIKVIAIKFIYFVVVVFAYYAFYANMFQILNTKYGSIFDSSAVIISIFLAGLGLYLFKYMLDIEDQVVSTFDVSSRTNLKKHIYSVLTKNISLKDALIYLEGEIAQAYSALFVKISLQIEYFKDSNYDFISIEELRSKRRKGIALSESEHHLVETMENKGISHIFPIKLENELLGELILGDKSLQIPYTINDTMAMQDILQVVAIGIKKILLFEEVENFNSTLQKEVNDATAEITRQKNELQEKYQYEKDMMGIMGHELRTPMTVAKGMAELLIGKVKNAIVEKDYVLDKSQKIYDSIIRESELIQTMLSTSHVETGKMNLQVMPVDILEIVEFVVSAFKQEAENKGLQFMYEKPESKIPLIDSDQARVQEIINNLVSNAVKYTHQGHIKISLTQDQTMIYVHVEDTGIGIPPEEIKNLGKKFYRLHQHLDKYRDVVRAGGTGLGLYVVRGVLKALGGELLVESEIGKGSVFTASFPLVFKQQESVIVNDKPVDQYDMFEKLGLKTAPKI